LFCYYHSCINFETGTEVDILRVCVGINCQKKFSFVHLLDGQFLYTGWGGGGGSCVTGAVFVFSKKKKKIFNFLLAALEFRYRGEGVGLDVQLLTHNHCRGTWRI
jgi:hypothetical protein